MTKKNAIEILREEIRRARIERDQGNNAQHDRIIYMTHLLNRIRAASAIEAKQIAEQYNITND